MQSGEIREKFLKFFEARGHAIVPSSSLVPENDPTTLFTGSGMQPMLPYLLGAKYPKGTRVVDSQKSFRTNDIEEVGDNRHTTFFEMLGNWSFGDYFKEEQLTWISQFLFDEVKIDPSKLYVTVFGGDEKNGLPKDSESVELWKKIFKERGVEAEVVEIGSEENGSRVGMQGGRIFFYGDKNWWSRAGVPDVMPVGEPGGPDSEIFYEFSGVEHDKKFGEHCHPNCDCGRYLEIGNNVFMTYKKVSERSFDMLPSKNIDFGGGLERITAASINNSDVFSIDVFQEIFSEMKRKYGERWEYPNASEDDKKIMRIIADHLRAAVFLISDGVVPSNTDRGYYLRRILRRAIYKAYKLTRGFSNLYPLVPVVIQLYSNQYPELKDKEKDIHGIFESEEIKFMGTLERGLKEFNWRTKSYTDGVLTKQELPPLVAFELFTTYGFPFELIEEVALEHGMTVDKMQFQNRMDAHRIRSRAGSEQKFKGGLAGHSEMEVKYHTATHLLHQALHDVLGDEVSQKGSNITPERLRFDFSFPRKLTDEEKKRVEEIVNEKIDAALPVQSRTLHRDEAVKTGARHFFDQKYPDEVSVYYIGDSLEEAYSKEFCGGPHVANTGTLGKFKIVKEEAVSAGVRRIKAVLE